MAYKDAKGMKQKKRVSYLHKWNKKNMWCTHAAYRIDQYQTAQKDRFLSEHLNRLSPKSRVVKVSKTSVQTCKSYPKVLKY